MGGSRTNLWPYASRRAPGWRRAAAPVILVVALLGFQAWAVVGYHDDWPFAANAMFAFPRDGSDPVYDLQVRVRVDEGWRPLDPAADLGIARPENFRRMFFSRYYGSTDGAFPQRSFSSDDRRRFELRLSTFCAAVARSLATRDQRATALDLRLVEFRREGLAWSVARHEPVGTCDPIDSPFRSARR